MPRMTSDLGPRITATDYSRAYVLRETRMKSPGQQQGAEKRNQERIRIEAAGECADGGVAGGDAQIRRGGEAHEATVIGAHQAGEYHAGFGEDRHRPAQHERQIAVALHQRRGARDAVVADESPRGAGSSRADRVADQAPRHHPAPDDCRSEPETEQHTRSRRDDARGHGKEDVEREQREDGAADQPLRRAVPGDVFGERVELLLEQEKRQENQTNQQNPENRPAHARTKRLSSRDRSMQACRRATMLRPIGDVAAAVVARRPIGSVWSRPGPCAWSGTPARRRRSGRGGGRVSL